MKRLLALAAVLALTACSSITPRPVVPAAPSWDGSEQNSGLVADKNSAMTVTPHWRDRYNSLIAAYGDVFKPGLTPDEGITPAPGGQFFANHFARVHFYTMNIWDHSAMHAPKTLLQKTTGL